MKLTGHGVKNGGNRLLGAGSGGGDQQRKNGCSRREVEANNDPAPRWAFRMIGRESSGFGQKHLYFRFSQNWAAKGEWD